MSVKNNKDEKPANEKAGFHAASECGVTHSDCINTWKGTCDREADHSGSHHCSSCGMTF